MALEIELADYDIARASKPSIKVALSEKLEIPQDRLTIYSVTQSPMKACHLIIYGIKEAE